jgi:hypothetical protein
MAPILFEYPSPKPTPIAPPQTVISSIPTKTHKTPVRSYVLRVMFGVVYEERVIKERIRLVCGRSSATKTSKEENVERKQEKETGPTIKPTQ